jgi:peptidoglycan hydrolase CwlO-like protein
MLEFFKQTKKQPKDLKSALSKINELEGRIEELFNEIKKIKKDQKFSIQKVGIVRFNPFSEVGGDQSFSIALLNENDDGVVITSLYTRQENRVYGKPIKNSQSEYSLSEEEKKAIEKAIEKAKNPKIND